MSRGILTWLVNSVHHGVSGALKSMGPRPNSPRVRYAAAWGGLALARPGPYTMPWGLFWG